MPRTDDPVALDDWYAVATAAEVGAARRTRLLGQPIEIRRGPAGPEVREVHSDGTLGPLLPVREKHACLWTTLGRPAKDVVAIAEAEEPDRRTLAIGWVTLRTSGPRMIENFLDMAHFPFVHPEILGAEPHTEVPDYRFEIRRDVDEVWATNCRFFNARWAQAGDAVDMNRTYRIPSPFAVVLYRASRADPARRDVLAAFVHPLEETLCRVQVVTWLVDRASPRTDLMAFEQVIFLQDRIIVENQRPLRLPLDVGLEMPTRADGSSVAYRRWLKGKGLRFGVTTDATAALAEIA